MTITTTKSDEFLLKGREELMEISLALKLSAEEHMLTGAVGYQTIERWKQVSERIQSKLLDTLSVGDVVISRKGHPLHCGSGLYSCALVASPHNPFILRSIEGDMTWYNFKAEHLAGVININQPVSISEELQAEINERRIVEPAPAEVL